MKRLVITAAVVMCSAVLVGLACQNQKYCYYTATTNSSGQLVVQNRTCAIDAPLGYGYKGDKCRTLFDADSPSGACKDPGDLI